MCSMAKDQLSLQSEGRRRFEGRIAGLVCIGNKGIYGILLRSATTVVVEEVDIGWRIHQFPT